MTISYDTVTFDPFPITAEETINIEQNINVTNNALIKEFVNCNEFYHNMQNHVKNVVRNFHKIYLYDKLFCPDDHSPNIDLAYDVILQCLKDGTAQYRYEQT